MRLARTRRTLIAALFAPLALLAPTTAHAAPAAAEHRPARHVPGETITLPVRDALAELTVADESRAGYSRDKFKHWTDADEDGCNTRAEVLLEEAVTAPEVGAKCTLSGGSWYSPYDDRYLTGFPNGSVCTRAAIALTIAPRCRGEWAVSAASRINW